jgi:hypothetical protein
MKTILIAALSAILLLVAPAAWAGGPDRPGEGGYMNGRTMDGGSQWRHASPMQLETFAREAHERRQYEEAYRHLRQAIDTKQAALNRELNRRDPDLYKIEGLHHDLGELGVELAHAERWFDLLKQEEAGRHPGAPYSNAG